MSKIWYYRMFQKIPQIRPYLPNTARYDESLVTSFFNRYSTVYIKPDIGGRGRGVIKAWKKDPHIQFIKERGTPESVSTVRALTRRLKLGKWYIVQQAIDLACINGHPFDIRLMMMRDRKKQWNYVGMVAKVAGEQSVITNIERGKGYVTSIDHALKSSLGLSGPEAEKKKQEMIRLAKLCTQVYSEHRYDWQIGYDLAIDRSGKVWLIEINPTVPDHNLFREQPSVYRTIKQLARFHYKSRSKAN